MNKALIEQDPLAVFKGKVIYDGLRDVKFEFMPTHNFSIDYNLYFEYTKCCPEPAPKIFQNIILKTFSWEEGKMATIECVMNEDRHNFEEFPHFETDLNVYVYYPECIITKEINKILSMTPEDRRKYLELKEQERLSKLENNWVDETIAGSSKSSSINEVD
jgi:hypothetical protein